jgi:hypothetical protein
MGGSLCSNAPPMERYCGRLRTQTTKSKLAINKLLSSIVRLEPIKPPKTLHDAIASSSHIISPGTTRLLHNKGPRCYVRRFVGDLSPANLDNDICRRQQIGLELPELSFAEPEALFISSRAALSSIFSFSSQQPTRLPASNQWMLG